MENIYKEPKIWTGEQVIKVRELGAGNLNNLNMLKTILLPSMGFLTRDEILYSLLYNWSIQISDTFDAYSYTQGFPRIRKDFIFKFENLSVKHWNETNATPLDLNCEKILVKAPPRTTHIGTTFADSFGSPTYNVREMCACLEFINESEGGDNKSLEQKVEWVMRLPVADFKILEAYYNENRFLFNPVVSPVNNTKDDKPLLIPLKIDTIPGLEEEWGIK